MMGTSTFFALGLGLGMLHAFDADHLAAVAGLGAGDRQLKLWRHASHWAFGHGSALLLAAGAVLLLHLPLPEKLSAYAELSVPFLLISLALVNLWRLWQGRTKHASHRGAGLMGLIHGCAGSAPLLALIPMAQVQHPVLALSYVLFFSAGVALAMCSLGALIGLSIQNIASSGEKLRQSLQYLFSVFSLLVGLLLITL